VVRVLVLFTRDLRLHDHPALWEACLAAEDIVPLFVVDPTLVAASGNRARFLAESLIDLDREIAHRGGRLFIRHGDPVDRAAHLAIESGSDSVFVTRDVGAYATSRIERLRTICGAVGIGVREFPGHAIVEPGDVVPAGRRAYRVFTPYLTAWSAAPLRPVLEAPAKVNVPVALDPGRLPEPRSYRPTAVDLPTGGESIARRRLRAFVAKDLRDYGQARDDLAADLTSRLSPYLRFGCLSPTEVATRVGRTRETPSTTAFIRQLAWRDYFRQRLAEEPWMSWRDLRSPQNEPTQADPAVLEAWKEGRTGVPLVDAGMRQLAREGWMHNRARLVAASFLTRTAGHRWQDGARHFAQHLVDGDPANNAGNWQWVAGTGISARRGRALNPTRQAARFDPAADYVRRYVQELSDLEGDVLLRPQRYEAVLRSAGYPAPVIAPERSEIDASTRSAAARRSTPR
jgi:deoxyribodipyrimidine photo-lyase